MRTLTSTSLSDDTHCNSTAGKLTFGGDASRAQPAGATAANAPPVAVSRTRTCVP